MNVFGINLPKINLPKIDIGSIGKEVLSKGVDLLKTVAKDAFAPATDGKGGVFNKELDIKAGPLSIRLKNPVDVLAEKLLGKVSSKVSEMGFDGGAVSNMLRGALPGLTQRITEYLPTLPALPSEIGGGATSIPSGMGIGGSTASSVASGTDFASKAINDFAAPLSSLDKQINAAMNKGGEMDQMEMLKLQQKMQRRNEMYQMLSQIMQMEHETKKGIIGNIR